MRSRRRALAFVALAVLPAAAGCALILGLDDKPLRTDAGPPAQLPDPCGHVVPPAPPARDDDDATQNRFVVAIRRIDVGTSDAGALGFDMDNSCTCGAPGGANDAAASCKTPIAPPKPPVACDPDGGVDNAFGGLGVIQATQTATGIDNDDVECGRSTVLFIIRNYNGKANDTSVQLAPVVSPGIDSPHDAGEAPSSCNDGGLATVYAPHWDGNDVWSSDDNFIPFKGLDPLSFLHAYVRDWMLVASAQGAEEFSFLAGPILVKGRQATIVGQIEPLDENGAGLDPADPTVRASRIKLRGQVAARIATAEIFKGLENVPSRTFGYLCPDSVFFPSVKGPLCAARDIMADPARDFKDDDCDAISMSLAFQAEPVRMSESKHAAPARPSPCGDTPATCD